MANKYICSLKIVFCASFILWTMGLSASIKEHDYSLYFLLPGFILFFALTFLLSLCNNGCECDAICISVWHGLWEGGLLSLYGAWMGMAIDIFLGVSTLEHPLTQFSFTSASLALFIFGPLAFVQLVCIAVCGRTVEDGDDDEDYQEVGFGAAVIRSGWHASFYVGFFINVFAFAGYLVGSVAHFAIGGRSEDNVAAGVGVALLFIFVFCCPCIIYAANNYSPICEKIEVAFNDDLQVKNNAGNSDDEKSSGNDDNIEPKKDELKPENTSGAVDDDPYMYVETAQIDENEPDKEKVLGTKKDGEYEHNAGDALLPPAKDCGSDNAGGNDAGDDSKSEIFDAVKEKNSESNVKSTDTELQSVKVSNNDGGNDENTAGKSDADTNEKTGNYDADETANIVGNDEQ